jgi:nicotine blue oxidoreductase
LISNAVAAARGALPEGPLIVVIGADALRVRLALRRADCGARVVLNPLWRQGLATSLRAGLAAAPRATRAALVLLVDQPRVGVAALARLLAAWRRRPRVPAAAFYAGHAGVPAVLPRRSWAAVRAQQGDQGARALLRGSGPLTLVDLPEAVLDIDTPADLAALRRPASRRPSWRS